MKTATCRAALLGALLFAVCPLVVSADDVGPSERPHSGGAGALVDRKRATLVIQSADLAREVELILPRSMRSGAAGANGAVRVNLSPTQTVAAGVALSLAIVSAGLWFARSRRSPGARTAMTAVVVTAVVAGAGGYALGNYSPYADADANPGTLRNARPNGTDLSGEVRVLYAGEDGQVRLVIPKEVFQDR